MDGARRLIEAICAGEIDPGRREELDALGLPEGRGMLSWADLQRAVAAFANEAGGGRTYMLVRLWREP